MNNPINIKLEQTQAYNCTCGNAVFEQVYFLRIVPALLSPTMKPEKVPFPVFRCTNCLELVDFKSDEPKKKGLFSQ